MATRRVSKAIVGALSIGSLVIVAGCGDSSSGADSAATTATEPAAEASPTTPVATDPGEPTEAATDTGEVAQAGTGPESLEACVQRIAGAGAGGEQQDVTLNILTHDKGAADWLATMGEAISAIPGSPYRYELTQSIVGPTDVTVKTQAALQSGTGVSDIVGIEIGEIGNYYSALEENFVDLTTVLGPLQAENSESRWASYSKDGKIYGVETTYPISVYWYNAAEFDKLGIDPTQFATWDDLLAASSQTVASDGKYLLAMPLDWRGATFLAQQQGGGIFDAAGEITVDSPEMKNAADLIKRGLDEKAILGFSIADFVGAPNFAAMQNKEVIGYAFPDWWLAYFMKPQIADQEGDWRAMPLPEFEVGAGATSLSGGHALSVHRNGENADAATLLVVCGGATADGQIRKFVDAGFLPTNEYAWESPELLEYEDPFLGGQKLGALFASLRDQAPTFYVRPDLPVAMREIDNYLGQAYRGDIDVATALANAQAAIEAERN